MKRLYILRHAKSNMLEGVEDKERPLSEEGRHDARELGHKMAARGYEPSFVLCSAALRTQQTYEIAGHDWDIAESFEDRLYLASAGQLYQFIKDVDDKYESAILVGHNPGIHELVGFLTGKANQEHAEKLTFGYQPGTLSVFDCDIESWEQLAPGENALIDLLIGE